MRVYILPADKYGCGHYRLIWPASALRNAGFDVKIIPPKAGNGFLATVSDKGDGNQRLDSVRIPKDCDVLVLQRPAHPLQPEMIDMLRANGVAVVVDMDDDMSSIHPDNAAFHMYRPHSGSPFSWKWAAESCRRATLVTTSTRELQKVYAKHGRGQVLDNYVPAAYLSFPSPETGRFGWAGTLKSHPNDPQVASIGVQKLLAAGYEFVVVGDGYGVKGAMRLAQDPPATGSVELIRWAATIAESMDVGLIPLAATAFNTAKSRLKGIESMAVGVPWVASPRAEYRRLEKESRGGLLADSPKEWFSQVKRLMDDHVLRKELVETGREYMINQTYEANAWRWAETWERAYMMQKGVL